MSDRGASMSGVSRVVPAILTEDTRALETMVRQAEGFADYVQLDIMDGKFVPAHSISYRDLAALSIKLGWEAHLMVEHPEDYFEEFSKQGLFPAHTLRWLYRRYRRCPYNHHL